MKGIYTDGQHVVADTEDQLHEWVKRVLGFKREWYHDRYLKGRKKGQLNNHHHYDVLAASKKAVLKQHSQGHFNGCLHMIKSCAGVQFVSKKELLLLSHKMMKNGK